ncbi:hypothetical protein RhiJN_19959 [Ceratobasidium sp. AG-Ba]|nr:hypothetical protein RhiJN_19959 [Ceratobasidium sp. AG-Ba]
MRVWEELWHGELWWDLQSRVSPDQHILYLVLYIDETNVSKIGGVKVWPVYLWIGNLPASIRKQRGKKGGGTLIALLPKAQKQSGISDTAGLRCQVYHDALRVVFDSLKVPSRHGAPIRCGDGVIRNFVPTIAAGSFDYMELIRMLCMLGASSDCPCPICLVPRSEQSRLTQSWQLRSVLATKELLDRARAAPNMAKRKKILHEQSIRYLESSFFDIIPSIHSIYDAVVADPLHQIEQGIWGKHLWPWIRDQLPKNSQAILDERIKSIPRYPDLKRFPNGITKLEYLTGKEHGIILRIVIPLIEDLLLEKYRKLILGTFRSLAIIYLMKLAEIFSDVDENYPKFHSLSHVVDIIYRHSTTDNYGTGMGEALHPKSKKDYRRSSKQKNFEVQMLNMYREREAILRIRVRVDARAEGDDDNADDETLKSWDGPRVQFGSPDRAGRELATDFVLNYSRNDPANAKNIEQTLRTFIYQHIEGFQRVFHFRQSDLPRLDAPAQDFAWFWQIWWFEPAATGCDRYRRFSDAVQQWSFTSTLFNLFGLMQIHAHRLVTIGYSSMLDSRDGLDIARSTEAWHNEGSRYDYVLADDGKELFVAQILKLLILTVRSEQHSIAYVRYFKIGRRSKSTGFIELTDTGVRNFISIHKIVRSCVVLSPCIRPSKHVLWDLEGPDLFLRLQDISAQPTAAAVPNALAPSHSDVRLGHSGPVLAQPQSAPPL